MNLVEELRAKAFTSDWVHDRLHLAKIFTLTLSQHKPVFPYFCRRRAIEMNLATELANRLHFP